MGKGKELAREARAQILVFKCNGVAPAYTGTVKQSNKAVTIYATALFDRFIIGCKPSSEATNGFMRTLST